MSLRRVAITGLGAVTPLGATLPETMGGLGRNATGVRRMADHSDYPGLQCQIAAPAPDPDTRAIPRSQRRSMGRMSFFAVAAAREALRSAGIPPEEIAGCPRTGCIVGSTMGSSIDMVESFERLIPNHNIEELGATTFFKCVSHTAAMNVSQVLGLRGSQIAPAAACSSGLQAIGIGYDQIRLGRQDTVLCGGAEELHPTVTAAFDVLHATSTGFNEDPENAPRPFDRDRDGLVCGEGAGILVLEDYERARARKADIFGEIQGFHSCRAAGHVSESDRIAITRCIRCAMAEAAVTPREIDYVSAHATATLQGDKEEAAALSEIFGDSVPVSSLKGHMGHTLGASGAIELAAALAMARESRLYPTRNLTVPAPDCGGVRHLTRPLDGPVSTILKNSFAFGGVLAAIVVKITPED